MTDAVDRQLRALMARLHEMTPLPPSFEELPLAPDRPGSSDRTGARRRAAWAVAVAALAVVVVGAGVFVATREESGSTVTSQMTPPPTAASATTVSSSDVAGLWVFATRAVQVDTNRVGTGWPLPSPLPAYRFEPNGTVHGFDGCNQTAEGWQLVGGHVQTPPAPNNTGSGTAVLCVDSAGDPPMTVSAVPSAVSVRDGVRTLLHASADGSTAKGVRVDDLRSPATLAGTRWMLAVDGDDITISFSEDDTVEVTNDVAICSTGRYHYADRIVELTLSAPQLGCGDRQLGVLTSGPLLVASYSDGYAADTLLLASEHGAVRMFPSSTVTTQAGGG